MRHLTAALCQDKDPMWAMWGALQPPKAVLAELVEKARVAEDEAMQEVRNMRRQSWREWCTGQTAGSMKGLYRYVKSGPSSSVQLGLWTSVAGETYADRKSVV